MGASGVEGYLVAGIFEDVGQGSAGVEDCLVVAEVVIVGAIAKVNQHKGPWRYRRQRGGDSVDVAIFVGDLVAIQIGSDGHTTSEGNGA